MGPLTEGQKDDLRTLLGQVPRIDQEERRRALLSDVPASLKDTINPAGAPALVLDTIVDELTKESARLADGTWAIRRVIDRAIELSAGLLLERRLGDLLSALPSEPEEAAAGWPPDGARGAEGGAELPPPYPGLSPFDRNTARFFFGREREIGRIVNLADTQPYVLLFGPSAAGKSSLVAGGFLPRIVQERRPWAVQQVLIGQDPYSRLTYILREDDLDAPQASERAVARSLTAARPPRDRLLLVVDQFEQLFALSGTDVGRREQERFLGALQHLSRLPTCTVLLSVRADFGSDLINAALWPKEADQLLKIEPLSGDALREAIVQPARRAGVTVEDALAERLVADAAGEPGRLPLLQETMRRLWLERDRGALSLSAYQRLGGDGYNGLAQALADHAQEVMVALTGAQRRVARRVFLELVQFVEGRPDTRRQRRLSDLRSTGEDPALVDATIERLAEERLLTQSGSAANDERRIDLAHEVLISAWPDFREWLEEHRGALVTKRRLDAKAVEWLRLNGLEHLPDRESLLDQSRRIPLREGGGWLSRVELLEAEEWLTGEHASVLGRSDALAVLVETSRERIRAEDEAAQAARRRELEQARMLTAAGAAAQAHWRVDDDPQLALLLAAEAVRVTRRPGQPPLALAEDALRQMLSRARALAVLPAGRPLLGVAYGRDGERLAAAGDDGTLVIWDVPGPEDSGRLPPRAVLPGHQGPVLALASASDGGLATAGEDGTVRLWREDGTGGEPVPLGHAGPVQGVTFHPHGGRLATAGEDGTVRFWDLRTRRAGRPLDAGQGPLWAVDYSRDGSLLATAGEDGTVRLWSADGNAPRVVFAGHVNRVLCLAWRAGDRQLVTGGEDGRVLVWNTSREGGSQRRVPTHRDAALVLRGHTGPVRCIAFTPTDYDAKIVTASDDGTVRTWHATNGGELNILRGHDGPVRGAAFSPDGNRLLTAGRDGTARQWSMGEGEEFVTIRCRQHSLLWAAYAPDEMRAVTASGGATSVRRTYVAEVWDAVGGRLLATLRGHEADVRSAVYSPDGRRILTASDDGTARLWDADAVQVTGEGPALREVPPSPLIAAGQSAVLSAGFSKEGTLAVTSTYDGTVHAWDAHGRRKAVPLFSLRLREGPVWSAAFSPQGDRIVAAGDDGAVLVWPAAKADRPLAELAGHDGPVNAAIWGRDGRSLLTAGKDGTARLWREGEPNRWQETDLLRVHGGPVWSAAWSPDGRLVATGSEDGTVRLWEAASGRLWSTLRGHRDKVRSVDFDTSGRRLLTACADRTVRQWATDAEGLLQLAEGRVGRALTPDERAVYLAEPVRNEPHDV